MIESKQGRFPQAFINNTSPPPVFKQKSINRELIWYSSLERRAKMDLGREGVLFLYRVGQFRAPRGYQSTSGTVKQGMARRKGSERRDTVGGGKSKLLIRCPLKVRLLKGDRKCQQLELKTIEERTLSPRHSAPQVLQSSCRFWHAEWKNCVGDEVLAVSKVLIAPTISNLVNFGTERDTTKKPRSNWPITWRLSNIIRCISDASLSVPKLRRFEKIGAINTFETDITRFIHEKYFQHTVSWTMCFRWAEFRHFYPCKYLCLESNLGK